MGAVQDERTGAYAIIPPMFPPLRHIFLPLADKSRPALNFLITRGGLILCALFLLAGLVTAGDYGIRIDELLQRHTTEANLNYILGRADRVATHLRHDRVYGVAFELPMLLAERALGLTDNYSSHRLRAILTHLFFIVGGYFCYRLAYRLFNNRLLALFALLFFLLHPRIYGSSFINSKDLPFLSMFIIALYLLERAFRKNTLGAFLLLGVAVGLLTNLRIMGIMLFAAALGMRGLDLLYAGNGPERKRILLTAGLFAMAAGLTLYAVTPYAWANPVDYLLTSLNLTADHPHVELELFQGRLLPSAAMPPHYGLTWFGITTPPLFLLLGGIGIVAVLAQGLARPGGVFRNNRLRLQGLLLACFALPLLAAALLAANQYNGWRQSYFLYAPFCLLAAGGLHWLLAALTRQHRRRLAGGGLVGYGLARIGLGLALLQIVQLYPFPYNYFNFLVDRTTPERLRQQYQMDYLESTYQAGLAYLLERHPGETLIVRGPRRHFDYRPAADRQRLPATAGRNADYELLPQPDFSQPAAAFNPAWRYRLYNNTLMAVQPLNAARMTDAAIAAYRELYRQAVAGEPIIRADYNVYREGRLLAFVKENCSPEEPDAWFGVRLFPPTLETLPPYQYRRGSYVPWGSHGVRLGRLCLAFIQLPDFAQGDLTLMQRRIGNFKPKGLPLWEELYSISRPGLRELIADYRRQEPPAAANAFDVFLDRAGGRNRLLYAKKNCAPAEYETRVTLHIYPVDLADLPARRRDSGFDNRDFLLEVYGGRPGGECIAVVPLPDYPIQALRTGQADRWQRDLYPPADPVILRETYAALADRQPDRRAAFDLYWQGNRLAYLRETCAAADTAANFFLHIIPEDAADLPAERRAAGFVNLDFVFEGRGGHFNGKCLAAVALPDYAIAAVRTGQYGAGQGELWAAELAGGR